MKVDPRTLLLAEQAHRDDGRHATADLLRDTIRTINGYRFTLRLARIQIVAQQADLDVVLKRIDEVLE